MSSAFQVYGLLMEKAVVLKEQKYHLYLSDDEYRRVLQSLIRLKNSLTAQGRYTDGALMFSAR